MSQYHVFSLPQELLDTLVPRNIVNRVPSPPPSEVSLPAITAEATDSRACNICLGATFTDVAEQRAHFHSDWHRINVKIRLEGSKPLSEAQFTTLMESLEDSLSGSASSSSESDSDESDDAVATLHKTRKLARTPSPTEAPKGPQTALAWFHSPPATQIGIYKVLFPTGLPPAEYIDELRDMQRPVGEGRTWALFMTAGGHFAGAVVRVGRAEDEGEDQDGSRRKGKPRRPKPDTEVLQHKTFHRYTTRRKQGGSQSLNDNTKSKAVSAGAQLRRYGEQALRDDIRNLLTEWAEEIEGCERIFIRASVSNRRIFLDYDGAVIAKGDERLRTFPFPTRRPTQSELSRCLQELTHVKVSHLTEDALRAQDEAYLASLPKPKAVPTVPPPAPPPAKPKAPVLTRAEELERERWTRVLDMTTKGRLDALKAFVARDGESLGGINALVPEWTGARGGTLLQVAAAAGQEDTVRWLLEDARADPTVDVPAGTAGEDDREGRESDAEDAPAGSGTRRTAYDLGKTRAVRNVFRRAAAAHPEWWDWLGMERGARVPSVLSKEMEAVQDERKKVRRKGLKDRVREREEREREKAVRTPTPPPVAVGKAAAPKEEPAGARRLGGTAGASDGITGLTPEMRAKVERERRARAAEARMKNFGSR